MIEGLKITVSSEELRRHLQSKGEFHAAKAKFYEEQATLLKAQAVPTGQTNDPVQSLQNSQRQHQAKSVYFNFLAEHVLPNEDYLLAERELEAIEIFQKYW